MRSGWMLALANVAVLAAFTRVLPADDARAASSNVPGTALVAQLAGDFIDIPSGDFRMGDVSGGGTADEQPVHGVHIEALRVGRTEVTRGQFANFVRATGYRTDAERGAGGEQGCSAIKVLSSREWESRANYGWRDPGAPQADSHPVVCISWNDAHAYIRWLNGQTGKTFRLLSEAEWEYAARAGTVSKYPWGMDVNRGCRHANGADTSPWPGRAGWADKMDCNDGFYYTAPVGSFQANPWGLHDMTGNVWEWTEDCYHDSYDGAPRDGSSRTAEGCANRVLRGGSWGDTPSYLRVSNRYFGAATMRNDNLGFRLAQDE